MTKKKAPMILVGLLLVAVGVALTAWNQASGRTYLAIISATSTLAIGISIVGILRRRQRG